MVRLPLLIAYLFAASSAAWADSIHTFALGDEDSFMSGDAVDLPPRSALLEAALSNAEVSSLDFDEGQTNSVVAYSHIFSLPAGTDIISATLRLGWHPVGGLYTKDAVGLDLGIDENMQLNTAFGPRMDISDIGFTLTVGTTSELSINLSSVLMRPNERGSPSTYNLLSQLADGEFNIVVIDDTGIDYSYLEITTTGPVVPAPSAALAALPALLWLVRSRPSRMSQRG